MGHPSTPASLQSTVILTSSIADAPLHHLKLYHSICLPCRSRGSRCEGHQNWTVECTQCKKRGSECAWRLGGSRKRKRAKTHETTNDDEEAEEEEQKGSGNEDGERENAKAKRRRPTSTKLPVPSAGWPARAGAGAKLVGASSTSDARALSKDVKQEPEKVDIKGKNRAKVETETARDTDDAASDSSSSSDEDDEDMDRDTGVERDGETKQEASKAAAALKEGDLKDDIGDTILKDVLNRIQSSEKGQDFLHLSSYTSLLTSLFAEDSSNLAASLYWWEDPSSSARTGIRNRYLDPRKCMDEDWGKLTYLERLLAENAYSWSLWPRPTTTEGGSILNRGKEVDKEPHMAEEIAGIALRQLQDSGHIEKVLESLTPLHIDSLISTRMSYGLPPTSANYGLPPPGGTSSYSSQRRNRSQSQSQNQEGNAPPSTVEMTMQHLQQVRSSVFHQSTYSIPPLSRKEYTEKYLDKDDLLLDHLEEIRVPLILDTLEKVNDVLLTIAEFRRPEGMRRHKGRQKNYSEGDGASAVGDREAQEKERLEMSEKQKGKQSAVDQDDMGRSVNEDNDKDRDHVEEDASAAGGRAIDAEGEGAAQDTQAGDTQQVPPKKSKRRKQKQGPGDWKTVLLAASCVKGLPRSALEATMHRLEDMYGPLGIDLMKRYDAINPPLRSTAASTSSSTSGSISTNTDTNSHSPAVLPPSASYKPRKMVRLPKLPKKPRRTYRRRGGEDGEVKMELDPALDANGDKGDD